VERSGLGDLREGQKVGFELVADRKSGKMSAENLKDLG
jgi:CspA family cold shock protein